MGITKIDNRYTYANPFTEKTIFGKGYNRGIDYKVTLKIKFRKTSILIYW